MSHYIYNDNGRCRLCRRKRDPKPRRRTRVCIASSVVKGWRLFAYPLSYRVCRLTVVSFASYPVYMEVQRFPRSRNKWIDQEDDCAVAMFERRIWDEYEKKRRDSLIPNGSYASKVWKRLVHRMGLRRDGFERGGLL